MVVDVVNTPHVNIVNGNNYFVKASDISLLVITLEFFHIDIFSYIRLSLYVLIDSYESAYLIFKKYLLKKSDLNSNFLFKKKKSCAIIFFGNFLHHCNTLIFVKMTAP